MSEPWNRDSSTHRTDKPDRAAKLMLYGGLTISLITLVVGSIVKPVVQRIKKSARKEKV